MEKRRRGVRSEGCAAEEAMEEKAGDSSTVTEETAQDMILRGGLFSRPSSVTMQSMTQVDGCPREDI